MKINLSYKSKLLICLISMISFLIAFVGSIISLFINFTILGEVFFWITHAGVWISIFETNMIANNYKWKYLFAKKNFRNQINDYFIAHPNYTKKEKNKLIKKMKDTFRKTGLIYYFVDEYIRTPYKLWKENNFAFNYGNAPDYQKISYLVFALRLNIEEDSPLFEFFQYISFEPFSYEEYCKLIKKCNYLSSSLKNILTNEKYKEIFYFLKKQNNDENYLNQLNFYREECENVLNDYIEEIIRNSELVCLMDFFLEKSKEKLPINTVSLFVSRDDTKRIYIYLDSASKLYKYKKEEFVFYETEKPLIHSEGAWTTTQISSSFFETPNLALKEINSELSDFYQVDV